MSPFKIIQKRPIQIPANIGAVLNGLPDPPQMLFDKFLALFVLSVGNAVLGHIDWFFKFFKLYQTMINTFGICFPIHFRHPALARQYPIASRHSTIHMIVVQTDKVVVGKSLVPKIQISLVIIYLAYYFLISLVAMNTISVVLRQPDPTLCDIVCCIVQYWAMLGYYATYYFYHRQEKNTEHHKFF